jgi:uncharacterized protein (UPF0262 family)
VSPADGRQKLINIKLDEKTFVRRKPEVEHERAIAIYDLLEENYFHPSGDLVGPYTLHISLSSNHLIFDVRDEGDLPLTKFDLSLAPFRTIVKDYFMVCESYYSAIKKLTPTQIEAIDQGRRGLHDDGSELLREGLAGKVDLDFQTARRLFTLICILHIRG